MDLQWPQIRELLPIDLEEIAVRTGALMRRRGVPDAESLLRLNLMYALPKATFASVSVLAKAMGLAEMNASALFFRVRDSEMFLAEVLSELLRPLQGLHKVRIADATVLCGPNAKGPDQRVHVCYDPKLGLPIFVEITDRFGGEHLDRHPLGSNALILGDRAYGYEREIAPALNSGAQFLVRVEPCSNRFYDCHGRKLKQSEIETGLSLSEPKQMTVYLFERSEPLRLVGALTPEGKSGFILTNVPEEDLPTNEVREFYRTRWQIELFFKRMKSLLDLDDLTTRDGPTARPWILAKFILAVLLVRAEQEIFSPRQAYLKRLGEVSKWPLEYVALVA
jgi:hypothetical protein